MSLTQYASKNAGRGLDKLITPGQLSATPRRKEVSYSTITRSFDRQRHCDAQFIQDTSHTKLYTQLEKKKIYHKICQWYESWTPAQQKVLLCGLTRICTTTQLESIATSIEPLFHAEVLQRRNTLRPLGDPLKDQKKKEKKKKKRKQKGDLKLPFNQGLTDQITQKTKIIMKDGSIKLAGGGTSKGGAAYVSPLGSPHDSPRRSPRTSPRGSPCASPCACPSPAQPASPFLSPAVSPGGSPTHSIVFSDAGMEIKCDEDPLEAEAVASIKSDEINRRKAMSADSIVCKPQPQKEPVPMINVTNPSKSDTKEKYLKKKYKQKKLILVALDKRVTSQHHNALQGHQLTALSPVSQSLEEVHSRHRSKLPSQISISQVFSAREVGREPMQGRFLRARSPLVYLPTVSPVQKQSKSGTVVISDPKENVKVSVIDREKLNSIFKEQMDQIWTWLDGWKTYERLEFVALIVKISSPAMLSYLAQCLCQRLQERVDITWLSDDLLVRIFSYLPAKDILACSEVCRTWYFVAANEDMWKKKCKIIGDANGIPQVIRVVRSMNPNEEIDWRIAYIELENNIKEQKELQENTKRLMESRQRKTPDSARSILHEIPTMRRWQAAALRGPQMKLGQKLAEESAKLKDKYRQLLQNEKTRLYALRLAKEADNKRIDDEELEQAERRLAFRRATSIDVTKKQSEKILTPLDTFKLGQHEFSDSDSLTNSMYEENEDENREPAPEQALDVLHDPVQAKELLGKDPHGYLDSWINLACIESALDEKPKRGGILSVRCVKKLLSHLDPVQCFVYDKKRLISGSIDRSIRIWDLRSLMCIHKLQSHKGGVGSLLLDVNTLYSGSWDTSIMIWDLRYFQRLAVLTGHRGSVIDLYLWEHKLVSASHDGTVRIWDVDEYECLHVLDLHTQPIMSMVVDHVEDTVITGSSDCSIRITSLRTLEPVHVMVSSGPINCLILQAGLIISTNHTGKVTFWNKYEGISEAMIQCHDKQINSLGFRGSCFYTASDDWTIKEWDLMTLTCLRSLLGVRTKVCKIKLERKFMVSSDAEGEIWIWDFYTNTVFVDDGVGDDGHMMVKQLHESELQEYLKLHHLSNFRLEDKQREEKEKEKKDKEEEEQLKQLEHLGIDENEGNDKQGKGDVQEGEKGENDVQEGQNDVDEDLRRSTSLVLQITPPMDNMTPEPSFNRKSPSTSAPPKDIQETSEMELYSSEVLLHDNEFAEEDLDV